MESVLKKDAVPLRRLLLLLTVAFVALCGLFWWIVERDWRQTAVATEAPSRGALLEELSEGRVIEQTFPVEMDRLTEIALDCSVWNADDSQPVTVALLHGGEELAAFDVTPASFSVDGVTSLPLPQPLEGLRGETLTLRLTAHGGLSFWSGTAVNTLKAAVEVEALGRLTMDGKPLNGSLVMTAFGYNAQHILPWFWPAAGVLYALILLTVLDTHRRRKTGKGGFAVMLINTWERYSYLLRTLVSRDFRVKYRASVLGIIWSFLNPLLMMSVQYLVFSWLFHSAIENFPVYLMTGIIFFNFFNEATTLSMQSITANAGLIKKVYMPRWIYPFGQVLFALVNVTIVLIPLFLMILLTGLPVTKAALLLPLPILGIACFSLGMGMILATLNVYFRDTGFLWGIAVLLLTYLTPLFYPETIIPASWLTVYHLNPMYQFIYFIRCVLLQGVTPQPQTYAICAVCALLPLAAGFCVFRRKQDSFIYYL